MVEHDPPTTAYRFSCFVRNVVKFLWMSGRRGTAVGTG
jgi:hypothetical protein